VSSRRLIWFGAAVAFITGGCGDPSTTRVRLARVSGVVTLDRGPLANAIVVFEAEDHSFSEATTDRSGWYDLRFDSHTRGVTMGPKVVRISMNRRINGLNSTDEGGPKDRAGGWFGKQPDEVVPEKYNEQSVLTAHVSEDSHIFDFALVTTDKSAVAP
jgi:hypothetical protein